jgi:mRNA interferase HigB
MDVKKRYAHVSTINNHHVFNIGGNKFRLDTRINFDAGIVLANRIGTHEQYETWSFE